MRPRPAGRGTRAPGADTEKRLQRLAWLMDSSIPLPGGYRIGLDGLIGLVPGIGDVAGAVVSSYIIVEAGRLGAPRSLLVRMGFNVLLETVVGAVPLLGDLFDFAYKANLRNVRLLERYVHNPARARAASNLVAGCIVLGMLGVLVVAVAAVLALVNLVWQALSSAG
ncbi:MAG TPA: DUF4112 domain-containing protein [Gammaproteobacteria bacterium]|nr:DUF4112 domain-containing protein [Gammaproteobacteria bacterium]